MSVNENQLLIEVLLPELSGQIQQTTSDELKRWIKEGKLKPTHQVRLKNLPWIDAQNVPAFKSLFEIKKNEKQAQSDDSQNQPFFNSPAYKSLKAKINEKTEFTSSGKNSSMKTENDALPVKKRTKPAEHSLAFKLFEKKAQGKSRSADSQNETDTENAEAAPNRDTPKPQKNSYTGTKALGFLAGCFLMFLLSAGGSYLWVYQMKTAAQIDENSLPQLSNLSFKLTSDKLELRLRAEREKAQQIDINQEIAKLENQFKVQRNNLIEEHRNKLQTADFYNTFYFSFAVLLCLFLFVKIFVRKSAEAALDSQNPPALPQTYAPETRDIPTADDQEIESENSQNIEAHETDEDGTAKSKLVLKVKSPQKTVEAEESETDVSAEMFNCFLHGEKQSDFVCEDCAKFFCSQCTVTIEQTENCCFFCKSACKPVEFEETPTPASKTEQKKKKNLLDSGKNKNFVVRWFPEKRTNRVGIIHAFLIAVLFSSAISILWVYKISPYLENRGKEISQNIAPDDTTPPDKNNGIGKLPQTSNKNTQTNPVNSSEIKKDEPCIDPQTRQPFECDEETRKALHDHTEKIKSVEKAQQETKEKTNLILTPFLPSESPSPENANQENAKPNPQVEARKEFEKQQFIRVFIISFVTIFGLLMSTWLFAKDEKPEQPEDSV